MSKVAEVEIVLDDGTTISTFIPFKKVKKLDKTIGRMIEGGVIMSCGVTFDPDSVIGASATIHLVQ